MSSTEAFFADQPDTDVPRDRYGRYLLPDETGKDTGWTRATTFAATLAESYGLRIWEQRQVVWGLSRRPDLLTLASTVVGPEDKKALGAIVDAAHEAGGTKAKANLGSAIHRAIERVETGALAFEMVPDELKPDVFGYFAKLAEVGLTILPEYIERTVIVAPFKVAGTFDNVVRCPDGKLRILDKKTGNLDYAEIEFAVQMALYANATALRNYGTNRYEPMPEVAKDYAIIAHIEPGTGRVNLHRINIRLGWAWAATCAEVQDIRKTKHVLTPYVADGPALPLPDVAQPKAYFVGDPTPPASVPPRPIELLSKPPIVAEVLNMLLPPAVIAAQFDATFPDFNWDAPHDEDDAPFAPTPGVSAAGPVSASVPTPPVAAPTTVVAAPTAPTGAEPVSVEDAEARAEALVKGAKGKAKLQSIAKEIAAAATERGAIPAQTDLKLNQHQIKLARAVVELADAYGIALPVFEKPRRSAAPTEAESAEDAALTNELKYIRTMPTAQGLIEYKTNLGERWTDDHQEAARVRVEQIKAQQLSAGEVPLTPAQIITGATSPASLQQAWRLATNNGDNVPGWTPELESAAQAKAAELGVPRGD